jgi:hypothetical protein
MGAGGNALDTEKIIFALRVISSSTTSIKDLKLVLYVPDIRGPSGPIESRRARINKHMPTRPRQLDRNWN